MRCPACNCTKSVSDHGGKKVMTHGACGCTRDGATFEVCPEMCPHHNRVCASPPEGHGGHDHSCVICNEGHLRGLHKGKLVDWCSFCQDGPT